MILKHLKTQTENRIKLIIKIFYQRLGTQEKPATGKHEETGLDYWIIRL